MASIALSRPGVAPLGVRAREPPIALTLFRRSCAVTGGTARLVPVNAARLIFGHIESRTEPSSRSGDSMYGELVAGFQRSSCMKCSGCESGGAGTHAVSEGE